jgi:hypothetical protein
MNFTFTCEESCLKKIKIEFSDKELRLIIEALDSHAYWQLSDPLYRNSGFVMDPGSNDPEMRKQLKATNKLHDQLQGEINMLDGILHDCRKKDR